MDQPYSAVSFTSIKYDYDHQEENLYQEICQLMISAIGDYKLPLPEVIYLIEKVIKYQLVLFLDLAETISDVRDSKQIEIEDFLFLFRNDPLTLKRLFNFLSFEKSIKIIENDLVSNEKILSTKSSKKGNREKFTSFLEIIDNKKILLDKIVNNQNSIVDHIQIKLSRRYEMQDKNLTSEQYVELVNLRSLAFKNLSKRKYQKLKNLLIEKQGRHKKLSDSCNEILGFLFRELLYQIIEISLELAEKKGSSSNSSSSSITSNEIFEYCRLLFNDTISINHKSGFELNKQIKKCKKYLFF